MREGSFSNPRNTLDQQVPAGQYRNQRQADDLVLTADDLLQLFFEALSAVRGGNNSFKRHARAILLCEGLEPEVTFVSPPLPRGQRQGNRALSQGSAEVPLPTESTARHCLYCIMYSAGLPVSRSIRLAIGG